MVNNYRQKGIQPKIKKLDEIAFILNVNFKELFIDEK